jgi:hypothetical protein
MHRGILYSVGWLNKMNSDPERGCRHGLWDEWATQVEATGGVGQAKEQDGSSTIAVLLMMAEHGRNPLLQGASHGVQACVPRCPLR